MSIVTCNFIKYFQDNYTNTEQQYGKCCLTVLSCIDMQDGTSI